MADPYSPEANRNNKFYFNRHLNRWVSVPINRNTPSKIETALNPSTGGILVRIKGQSNWTDTSTWPEHIDL